MPTDEKSVLNLFSVEKTARKISECQSPLYNHVVVAKFLQRGYIDLMPGYQTRNYGQEWGQIHKTH